MCGFHDLGNTVIIAGRRMETLEKAIGDRPNIYALTLDMDDAASVATFAEKLVTDFPSVNVLFNSAGIMPLAPIVLLGLVLLETRQPPLGLDPKASASDTEPLPRAAALG